MRLRWVWKKEQTRNARSPGKQYECSPVKRDDRSEGQPLELRADFIGIYRREMLAIIQEARLDSADSRNAVIVHFEK